MKKKRTFELRRRCLPSPPSRPAPRSCRLVPAPVLAFLQCIPVPVAAVPVASLLCSCAVFFLSSTLSPPTGGRVWAVVALLSPATVPARCRSRCGALARHCWGPFRGSSHGPSLALPVVAGSLMPVVGPAIICTARVVTCASSEMVLVRKMKRSEEACQEETPPSRV